MARRGAMRHRAEFQSPAGSGNWTTEFTRRVAMVPLEGDSNMTRAIEESEIVWRVTMPYTSGIKSNWQIQLKPSDRILKINAWKNYRNRNKQMDLVCVERLRSGVTS